MKLCILGGGGFRTPYVYQALLRDGGTPRITEVALYDIDEDRLRSMTMILEQFAVGFDDAPKLVPTTALRSAIEGSDFVFAAIRVGGLEGRRCDEHVALDLGVIGQETTGPGGLAYAIRTVPVMMEVARLVKELAPQAYLMNFTNPAGIITEAMQSVLGDRVLGICDTPSGLGRRVARMLGLDHTRVQMDYVGLNHLGWMRRVLYDGEDVLPSLLSRRVVAGADGGGEGLRDRLDPHCWASSPTSTSITTTSTEMRSGRSTPPARPGATSWPRPRPNSSTRRRPPATGRPSCGARRWTLGVPATWPRPRAACRVPRRRTVSGSPIRPTRATRASRSA